LSSNDAGFLSLDCGGESRGYTDRIGINWTSDNNFISGGHTSALAVQYEQLPKKYTTVRYFPADKKKYCYIIPAKERTRYLVRASFLYGNFDKSDMFPKFEISLGDSQWSTILIKDATSVVVEEAIVLMSTPELRVCLSDAITGQPFISTLEIRMLSGSLYSTLYESEFFLSLSRRINFGAANNESIRYQVVFHYYFILLFDINH
jgi:hypothetical protein